MENLHIILYQVKPKDTLESIARKFHCSIYEIMTINRLLYPIIFIGQPIKIPYCLKNSEYMRTRTDLPKMRNTQSYINKHDLQPTKLKDRNLSISSPDGSIQVKLC